MAIMKSLAILFIGSITLIHGLVSRRPEFDPVLSGYKIVPMEVQVRREMDGRHTTLFGSVEDIHAQLKSLDPNYTTPFNQTESSTHKLVKRLSGHTGCQREVYEGNELPTTVIYDCEIQSAQAHLRSVKNSDGSGASCGVGPGPKMCSRVSCDNSVAVYFCNDSASRLNILCSMIADALDLIMHTCLIDTLATGHKMYWPGQWFSDDSWNYNVYLPPPTTGGSWYPVQCGSKFIPQWQPGHEVPCLHPDWSPGFNT